MVENKKDMGFGKAFKYKVIYVFRINDKLHEGLVKIGDATLTLEENISIDKLSPNCRELNQAALKRIREYTNTAGITPELLHTELAIKIVGDKIKAFRDHEVHRVLENSNIKKVTLGETTGREWFRIDKETAIEAIKAVKNLDFSINKDFSINDSAATPIIFRPEQKIAIEKTVKHFKKASNNRMLWNAKMRFGKTLSTLQVIKESKFKRSIIITHRPVVKEGE